LRPKRMRPDCRETFEDSRNHVPSGTNTFMKAVTCERRHSLGTYATSRLTLVDHSLRRVRTGVTMLSPQSF
jgi:hypothetical protein